MANRADRNVAMKKVAREIVREGFGMPELFGKIADEMDVMAAGLMKGEERSVIEGDARLLRELEKRHRREFSG